LVISQYCSISNFLVISEFKNSENRKSDSLSAIGLQPRIQMERLFNIDIDIEFFLISILILILKFSGNQYSYWYCQLINILKINILICFPVYSGRAHFIHSLPERHFIHFYFLSFETCRIKLDKIAKLRKNACWIKVQKKF